MLGKAPHDRPRVGAALSPAIGGGLARLVGWSPMFMVLGALSAVPAVLWLPHAVSSANSL